METRAMRSGFRQAIAAFRSQTKRYPSYQSRRFLATPTQPPTDEIRAAPPFRFNDKQSQGEEDMEEGNSGFAKLLPKLRIVPASPSYFTGKPGFTDDILELQTLLRKYITLPVLPPGEAPRIAWKTHAQYKVQSGEPVKAARYTKILQVLARLNYIHPSVMPEEVKKALEKYKRDVQPFLNKPKPGYVDEYGRARGVGRRKACHAVAYLVEGEGEVMINGKSLSQAFGRVHDRESCIWALKATDRIDKYNVWAVAQGGGTTGQAEAITLAVSKALMVHEPALKPALRRAGCVTRDPRRVERKKPGKLKARKMPAWVKR
ncbi:37S ribosomal protein S9, mitochondrial [Zalaria obscura]|uniref:37S ribosomal protein S9, mitochondrial n=1 Tax=Zalaria obscura TaxID=2024903 RepID=A0ACC3S476_9PEZI